MNCACFFVLLIGVSGVYSHHWKLFNKDSMESKVIKLIQTMFFPDIGGNQAQVPPKRNPSMRPAMVSPMGCPTMTTGSPQKQGADSRPCKLDDLECMRQFLSSNSECTITQDRVSNSNVSFESLIINFLGFNVSIFSPVLLANGMRSAKIIEFSVSPITNNLVIGINLQNTYIEVPDAVFYIHRRAQESVILTMSVSVVLPSFTITAIIPSIPNLRLDDAEIHSFFEAEPQNLKLGMPAESMDELTQKVLQPMLENKVLALKESIQDRHFLYYIVQNLLCNFGVPQ